MDDVLKDLGDDEDEEDSDDLLDDPAAFIERQSSQNVEDAKQAYVFDDDPKALARKNRNMLG